MPRLAAACLLIGSFGCNGSIGSEVLINELLSGNSSGLQDEFGEFPDWVELYNAGGSDVDVSGFTLTDEAHADAPWSLPAGTTIDAGGWLVVLCDEDVEQGPLHASFKLSALGETLTLSRPDGGLADEVGYPAQPVDDVGWARISDGAADWAEADPPTPGAAN